MSLRALVQRMASLFRPATLDRDLDDEVRFHLELLVNELVAKGMSHREARDAALRHFGGVTQMKEAYREQRGLPALETVVQDVRYGVRALLRTPGFTLAALVTLALGIGANTAIFSVVNAVLLRPLAYPEPDRIVAAAETASAWTALAREFPETIFRGELPSTIESYQAIRSRYVRPALVMMLEAVGVLLLIACANTANLLLARASGRGREMAVRAALGAARARIIRQLLTESVVLAISGAAIGVLLAYWSVPALLALVPPSFRIYADVRIDATVLVATLATAVLTGLLFGLAPALSLSRHDLGDAFKDEGTRTTSGRRAGLLRKALVVAEVGACMLLLVAAGLLIQTFMKLRSVDPGFDLSGVLTAQMSLQGSRYPDSASLNSFFEQGLERLRRVPGVQTAAVVNGVPIEQGLNLNVDILDGPEKIQGALTDWRYASTDYFRTMGIPIVAGRGFDGHDRAGTAPVAVVNEQFAHRMFKGTNAIGRHIRVFRDDPAIEIVGIAKDVRELGLVGRLPVTMYLPVTQANPSGISASHMYFPMNWVVRTSSTGAETVRAIRDEMRALDPSQPFSAFRTMEEVKMAQVTTERFQMILLALFAAIGLLLGAAGIYGLLAYSVAQRTREIGIRMALGAARHRILAAIVRDGAILASIGVLIGAAAAAGFAHTLRTFVWGVSTLDPLTYIAVAAILIAVSVLASLVPAVRAVHLDPVRALRE